MALVVDIRSCGVAAQMGRRTHEHDSADDNSTSTSCHLPRCEICTLILRKTRMRYHRPLLRLTYWYGRRKQQPSWYQDTTPGAGVNHLCGSTYLGTRSGSHLSYPIPRNLSISESVEVLPCDQLGLALSPDASRLELPASALDKHLLMPALATTPTPHGGVDA